jgi:hypothetical protein
MVGEGFLCGHSDPGSRRHCCHIKKGMVVVKTYMEECLDKTQKKPSAKRGGLKDFRKAVSRYIDWA